VLDAAVCRLAQEVFMDWYLMALKKYAEFQERQRKEYRMFTLFNFLAMVLLAPSARFSVGRRGRSWRRAAGALRSWRAGPGHRSHGSPPARYRQVGLVGLVALIPLIGSLILIYFAVKDSQPETNEYGPNPKAASI
jgi:uncharacterized membrane protein YhaH (DUF805 family)